ncbi:hypothetical protein LSAT2_000435 [Lamellibrachia satsuma]|nr:hypothetical protein LSAT2_000435 [Lamellibrachia satsuma]
MTYQSHGSVNILDNGYTTQPCHTVINVYPWIRITSHSYHIGLHKGYETEFCGFKTLEQKNISRVPRYMGTMRRM